MTLHVADVPAPHDEYGATSATSVAKHAFGMRFLMRYCRLSMNCRAAQDSGVRGMRKETEYRGMKTAENRWFENGRKQPKKDLRTTRTGFEIGSKRVWGADISGMALAHFCSDLN